VGDYTRGGVPCDPRPSVGRCARRAPWQPPRRRCPHHPPLATHAAGQVRDGTVGGLRGDPHGSAGLATRLATCAAKCETTRPAGSGGRFLLRDWRRLTSLLLTDNNSRCFTRKYSGNHSPGPCVHPIQSIHTYISTSSKSGHEQVVNP
jgi:hypothetical protein